ncbi:uncharacterized protein LOC143198604 [Rhynchophorus ferrugineus]|uniref:uncharacterized protein LOC143198604 n=1 Tax=Rhynchophorus ferrugineus TaxID=354439 RepID=UPI003FCE2E1E
MGSCTPFYQYKLFVSTLGTISSFAMRLLRAAIIVLFGVVSWTVVSAKIYQRCELARELRNFDIPEREIPTWVCIAQHESLMDTAAMNPGSGDHGLFQISQIYWCSPPGYGCNVPCDKFRDDDIADDLQCVRRIYNEHKRISGDGFNAWVVYSLYCKGDTSVYLAGCADDGDKPTTTPGNATENEISSEEEEDGDGYEFPPLPTYPKSTKNDSVPPFNRKSIHDYVLASKNVTSSPKTSNFDRLPYSKESIHHFIPVGFKLQKMENLNSDSITESIRDFKLISQTTTKTPNFESSTQKTVSDSTDFVTEMTFYKTMKESSSDTTSVKSAASPTRPIFTKESIYDFKLVTSSTDNLKMKVKVPQDEIAEATEVLVEDKKTISVDVTAKPHQMIQNKLEQSTTTIGPVSTLKSRFYQNTTPKNIFTARSYIEKRPSTTKVFETTDLEVQSSTVHPMFIKTNAYSNVKGTSRGPSMPSLKELDSPPNTLSKFGYKTLTSTTMESDPSVKLLSRFKDIEEKTVSPPTSTTIQPKRAFKQVTFAPGTFFNLQTLPPILPARPFRPPSQRPSNQQPPRPNNRPGGPPRPIRPGGSNIMQGSNQTIPEKPLRPGFGPNRRPVYNNAYSSLENAGNVTEHVPVKPIQSEFDSNQNAVHNNASFNSDGTTVTVRPEAINEHLPEKPLRPGFGHKRRPMIVNTSANSDELVVTRRPKPGHNRRHPNGRKPNRNRSMLKDDVKSEGNDEVKTSKPPESMVVTLKGNYMYYRTKYGFRLSRSI